MKHPRRALITVADKTGLVQFASTLQSLGWEMISTGGTRSFLEDAGFKCIDISSITGKPEAFGGRVKTLAYEIMGGILFDREKDVAEAEKLGIEPIDLVICNLYNFKEAWEARASFENLIEKIDIGGVSLIRAAAKNFRGVGVVTSPADYEPISRELQAGGELTLDTREKLMQKAFAYTADYDSLISTAMDELAGHPSIRLVYSEGKALRYGENPHQKAMMFEAKDRKNPFTVFQGKELSYNNLLDMHGAVSVIRGLKENACVVVKHANPCGIAEGKDQGDVFQAAWDGDPISAFGSIVAFNRPLKQETVRRFALDHTDRSKRKFVEIVIAPAFEQGTREMLAASKNLRAVAWDATIPSDPHVYRFLDGILLRQDRDILTPETIENKTEKAIDPKNLPLIQFGIGAVTHLASNAIVAVRRCSDGTFQLLGMGTGQPNRLASVRLTIAKCRENLLREAHERGVVVESYVKEEFNQTILVSDAFFPFPDAVEECAATGIFTLIQPGGSIRDSEVITRCNQLGVAMGFNGRRHFRH